MTVATPKPPLTEEPPHRRWTGAEYLRLAELGFFDGQRVELIDGEIIQMSPIYNAHSAVVSRLAKLLNGVDDQKYWVRIQATFQIGENFPEPDVAVVPGPIQDDGTFPDAALLIIEVSDSTVQFDRTKKMSLYASAGIQEYWVANIPERRVEVYRNPLPDKDQWFGHRYAHVIHHAGDDTLSPLFAPSLSFPANRVVR